MSAVTVRASLLLGCLLACRNNEAGLGPAVEPAGATPPGASAGQGGTGGDVGASGTTDAGGSTGAGGTPALEPEPGGVDASAPEVQAAAPDPGPPDAAPPIEVAPEVDPGPPPPGAGLVAHLKLDEPTGTRAKDSAGSNAALLRGGAHFVVGGFAAAKFSNPGALAFDGLDDDAPIELPVLPAVHAPKSLSLWVDYARLPPGPRDFIAFGNQGSSCGLHVGTRAGTLGVWLWDGTPLLGTPAPAPGWHHVAYASDGSSHQLYLNGVRVDASATTPQRCVVTVAVLGNDPSASNHFEGRLDDVRVYDRVLAPAEVRMLADGYLLGAQD